MTATFSSIQTRVERRVIDLPAAVVAEVPALVNSALRDLQKDHNFKVMEAVLSATTTVNTRTLTSTPADFKEFRGQPYYFNNDGTVRRLVVAASREDIWGPIDHWGWIDDEITGNPLVLLDGEPTNVLGQRNLDVYPLPDGNSDYDTGEYPITIPYWKFLPDLVSGSDENWFTDNAELYLIFQATSEAFSVDWDTEHAMEWERKAMQQRQRVLHADKLYRLQGVKSLVPHYRGERSSNLRL